MATQIPFLRPNIGQEEIDGAVRQQRVGALGERWAK
jgi:hypothetical protein